VKDRKELLQGMDNLDLLRSLLRKYQNVKNWEVDDPNYGEFYDTYMEVLFRMGDGP
jgi:hypothetical protein